MATGGYFIHEEGLTILKDGLDSTARGMKDMANMYGEIGRHAGMYVMGKEPIYAGPAKGRRETIHLQDHTKGGGGKTAWVKVSGVPYLMVQEFGGSSYWYRGGGPGLVRALNRGHKSHAALGAKVNGTGHIIYRKDRKPRGYFLWNVWWNLRSYVGEKMTTGIRAISERNGLHMDITERGLSIEQKPWSRAA